MPPKIRVKQHQRRTMVRGEEFVMRPHMRSAEADWRILAEASGRVRALSPTKMLAIVERSYVDEKEARRVNAHILAILLAKAAHENWHVHYRTAMEDSRLSSADRVLIKRAVKEMQANEVLA